MGKVDFIYLSSKKIILYQREKKKKEYIKKKEDKIIQFPVSKEKWKDFLSEKNSAILILSPSLLIFRGFNLPFGNERKIRKTIKYTLEPSLPFSAEEFEVFYTKRKEGKVWHLDAWIFPPKLLETIKNLKECTLINGVYLLPNLVSSYFYSKLKLPSDSLFWIRIENKLLSVQVKKGKTGRAREIPWKEKEFKFYFFSDEPSILSLPIIFFGEKEKWFDSMISQEKISIKEVPSPSYDILPLIISKGKFHQRIHIPSPSSTFSWKTTLTLLILLFVFTSFRLMIEKYYLQERIQGIKGEMKKIYLSTFPNSRVVDPLMQLRSKLKEKRRESSSNLIDILKELSLRYPGGISIEKMNYTGKEINIEGKIPSYKTLDNFLRNLNQSQKFFGEWEIVNAETKKQGGVRFHIRSKIK